MANVACWPDVLADESFREKVAAARVLAVGAGGIGCELLKTLVLSGFREIEVVDLDTIETSNLNRQFLFRRAHVGQSKARVAADVVASFAPDAHITAHQANIKEQRFGLDFIRSFSLVLNGLDNMDARRHVNRLCVAAGVPLVESGTAGYVGQVSVHVKGVSECYECQPKANTARKTYPICTLRNTPDKPIHCVVWAKELLFPRLFGKVDVSDLDEAAPTPGASLRPDTAEQQQQQQPDDQDAQAAAAAAAAAAEAAEAASFFKRRDEEAPLEYAVRVFKRLFHDDIVRLLGMQELWKSRSPPSPLDLESLLPDPAAAVSDAPTSGTASAARALCLNDQVVWPLEDDARVFLAATAKFLVQRGHELGSVVFDKDDPLAVDFVAAASNLRAACYSIPRQSAFAAKGMAGNIIHAIATTNAIVSGLIVVEALKLLAGCPGECVTSFLRTEPSWVGSKRSGRVLGLIYGERPAPPAAGCMVCGRARLSLTVNTRVMTLGALIDKVLKQRLAVNTPNLNTEGGFWYEEGEDLEPDEVAASAALLPRPLESLPGGGLRHGVTLCVSDQGQALSFELLVSHADAPGSKGEEPDVFVLEGEVPEAEQEALDGVQAAATGGAGEQQQAAADAAAAAADAQPQGGRKRRHSDDGDGVVQQEVAVVSDEQQQENGGVGSTKRPRGDSTASALETAGNDSEVICLD